MNQLEMVVTSVEKYSNLKNIPSYQVFRFFADKGILDMLLESYEVFKEMDEVFLVGVIDGYIENTIDAEEQDYSHYEERKKLLPVIAQKLSEHLQIEPLKALEKFYLSATGALFSKDETEYYGKTAEEIVSLYLKE